MADNFTASNKEEWKALIEKSSKGKSYESFSKEFMGIQINAFNMASDVLHSGAVNKQSTSWKIGVHFSEAPSEILNQNILYFLNLGVEAISIPISKVADLKTIYKDVHAHWIHNDLRFTSNIEPEKTVDFFPDDTDLSWNSPGIKHKASTALRPSYHEDPAQYILNLIVQAEELHEKGTQLDSIVVHVQVGAYLPLNLAFLRALRIVWANYVKAKSIHHSSFKIAAHINAAEDKGDLQLIEHCVASMNAAIGGVDFIFVESNTPNKNYARLALQIQNIMKMESRMEVKSDVLAGSFAMERLSNQLAKKTWELVCAQLA